MRENLERRRGVLHKLFEEWVDDGIDEETWNVIMDKDK